MKLTSRLLAGLRSLASRIRALRDQHLTYEAIGRCPETGKALLVRWTFYKTEQCWRMLHRFERSDERVFHDHPFNYTALLLFPGYIEVTPSDDVQRRLLAGEHVERSEMQTMQRRYYPPGTILHRPAKFAHRIELLRGIPSWSYVTRGGKLRNWGFFDIKHGWTLWRLWKGSVNTHCEDVQPKTLFGGRPVAPLRPVRNSQESMRDDVAAAADHG